MLITIDANVYKQIHEELNGSKQYLLFAARAPNPMALSIPPADIAVSLGSSYTHCKCIKSHIMVLLSLPQDSNKVGSLGHQLMDKIPSV